MRARIWIFALFCACLPSAVGGEKAESYLRETMIPAGKQFILRNGLPFEGEISTNRITRYKVDFFEDRLGATARLRLDDRYWFYFHTEGKDNEVQSFQDSTARTYYDLTGSPEEKVRSVRSLNLRNKLTNRTALALAKKHFELQGHKEENFHPVEFRQLSCGAQDRQETILLPFYEAEWYRNDVKAEDRERGIATLPHVRIEISGISSNLVYYSKAFMPVGKDR